MVGIAVDYRLHQAGFPGHVDEMRVERASRRGRFGLWLDAAGGNPLRQHSSRLKQPWRALEKRGEKELWITPGEFPATTASESNGNFNLVIAAARAILDVPIY